MAPPSVRDAGPTMEMYEEIVEISVGMGQGLKIFKAHKGVIAHYSGFFDRALHGEFHEGKSGQISLPEEQVTVFQRFIHWMYSGKIQIEESDGTGYAFLCKLWVFADRRDIPLLMNACIDALRDRLASSWKSLAPVLSVAYESTLAGSPLRRFLIHTISRVGGAYMVRRSGLSACNADALRDLLEAVWDMDPYNDKLTRAQLPTMDTCQFHRHEEGVSCFKAEFMT